MRFNSVEISQGATINKAYIQFTVDEDTDLNPCILTIRGEDIDNAPVFTSTDNNISDRELTDAFLQWQPGSWSVGCVEHTGDIKSIIQEIVNRPGWSSGNSSLVIIISGTGRRVAESHDGAPNAAPVLCVEFE
jgi:hypothetical protein